MIVGMTVLENMRKQKGISLDEVSVRLGISRNMLAAYESGKTKIPMSVFISLSEIYSCDIFDMFGVNTDIAENDVEDIEIAKAHARYVTESEREKDCLCGRNDLPEKYYKERYDKCVEKTLEYIKLRRKKNMR